MAAHDPLRRAGSPPYLSSPSPPSCFLPTASSSQSHQNATKSALPQGLCISSSIWQESSSCPRLRHQPHLILLSPDININSGEGPSQPPLSKMTLSTPLSSIVASCFAFYTPLITIYTNFVYMLFCLLSVSPSN